MRLSKIFIIVLTPFMLASCGGYNHDYERLWGKWQNVEGKKMSPLIFHENGTVVFSNPKKTGGFDTIAYDIRPIGEAFRVTFYKHQLDSINREIRIIKSIGTLVPRYPNNVYFAFNELGIKGIFQKTSLQSSFWISAKDKIKSWLPYLIPPKNNAPRMESYGFGSGLKHGLFIYLTFILKILGYECGLYAENNLGWPYWVGFVLALFLFSIFNGRN